MVSDIQKLRTEIISNISERSQVSFNDLVDMYFSMGVGKIELKAALDKLEEENVITSRSNGGILTYYILDKEPIKKVLIVEDDKNINKLMAISIGKDYEINQIYDGGQAISFVRNNKPHLVILDLMLPNKDGLDICQTIKTDKSTSGTIVILVSAMDPTSNRFKGIKFGADYYIKKPFDPKELSALVNIFLRTKGNRFDPLIDLPDEDRLSAEFEHSIKEGDAYVFGTIKIENIGAYARKFGEKPTMVILRLVSQLLQDTIRQYKGSIFLGFLNSTQFVIAGKKDSVSVAVEGVKREFENVLPFIYQDQGYKLPGYEVEDIFGNKEQPLMLSISFVESSKEQRKANREQILKTKNTSNITDGSAYTYEELERMIGNATNIDVVITRENNNVKLRIGKDSKVAE